MISSADAVISEAGEIDQEINLFLGVFPADLGETVNTLLRLFLPSVSVVSLKLSPQLEIPSEKISAFCKVCRAKSREDANNPSPCEFCSLCGLE